MLYVELTRQDGKRVAWEVPEGLEVARAWVAVLNARRAEARAVVVRVEGGRREEVGR